MINSLCAQAIEEKKASEKEGFWLYSEKQERENGQTGREGEYVLRKRQNQ